MGTAFKCCCEKKGRFENSKPTSGAANWQASLPACVTLFTPSLGGRQNLYVRA